MEKQKLIRKINVQHFWGQLTYLIDVPVKLAPLFVLDFVITAALWVAAGYTRGIAHFLNMSVIHYQWTTSIFDVIMASLARPVILGICLWQLRSNTLNYFVRFLILVFSIGPFAFSVTKLTLIMLSPKGILSLYGMPAFNYAALFFCVGMPVIEMLIVFYIFYTLYQFSSVGYTYEMTSEYGHPPEVERLDPSQLGEDGKHSNLSRVVSLAKPEMHLLFMGLFALLVGSLSSLAMPYFFGLIVGILIEGGAEAKHKLAEYMIILGVIFGIGAFFAMINTYLFDLSGQRLVARVRKLALNTMMDQDIAFFDKEKTGELTNRLSSDTQVLQSAVTTNISLALQNVTNIVGALILLFVTSWSLTLVMLAVIPGT